MNRAAECDVKRLMREFVSSAKIELQRKSLAHLLKSYSTLDFRGEYVSDNAGEWIANEACAEYIDFSLCGIGNRTLCAIAANRHVKIAILKGNNITDVEPLARNNTLMFLDISGNPVTEASKSALVEGWAERRLRLGKRRCSVIEMNQETEWVKRAIAGIDNALSLSDQRLRW